MNTTDLQRFMRAERGRRARSFVFSPPGEGVGKHKKSHIRRGGEVCAQGERVREEYRCVGGREERGRKECDSVTDHIALLRPGPSVHNVSVAPRVLMSLSIRWVTSTAYGQQTREGMSVRVSGCQWNVNERANVREGE